jgi:hypothetical protein
MGGIKSLICDRLASELCNWAIDCRLWVSATYIPGQENNEADQESRIGNDDKEWELNADVFDSLTEIWGFPLIDLLVSRLNNKVTQYVSWKPDPAACHVNAFLYLGVTNSLMLFLLSV